MTKRLLIFAAMGMVLALATPAGAALVHHYKLDGDLQDSVGTAHGTEHGSSITFSSTDIPAALGSGQSAGFSPPSGVALGTGIIPDGQGAVTLWIRSNATSSARRYAFATWDENFAITVANDILRWRGAGNKWVEAPITSGTAQSNWHHVAAVYDNSAPSGEQWQLYLDGGFAGFAGVNLNFFNYATQIGYWAAGDYWDGAVDDVRIYDHPLTEEEVVALAATIPEPATLSLLGLGALGVIARTKRKKA